jgi:hypothetical protein
MRKPYPEERKITKPRKIDWTYYERSRNSTTKEEGKDEI